MSRLLPHPWLSLALASSWCMLNASLHPAHLLLAAALGWLIPLLLRATLPTSQRPGRPRLMLRLLGHFAFDVVIANLQVARLVIDVRRPVRSTEVWFPLQLQEPLGLSLLTLLISMTPGTLASAFSHDQRSLRLHILDCDDPAAVVATIQERYERPLRQIFGEST